MRIPPKSVTVLEVGKHFATGAGLGTFLALSLIVANKSLLAAISGSDYPRLAMALFLACIVAFFGVGSAISGFILASVEKER